MVRRPPLSQLEPGRRGPAAGRLVMAALPASAALPFARDLPQAEALAGAASPCRRSRRSPKSTTPGSSSSRASKAEPGKGAQGSAGIPIGSWHTDSYVRGLARPPHPFYLLVRAGIHPGRVRAGAALPQFPLTPRPAGGNFAASTTPSMSETGTGGSQQVCEPSRSRPLTAFRDPTPRRGLTKFCSSHIHPQAPRLTDGPHGL